MQPIRENTVAAASTSRQDWLDFAKGLCIVSVVLMWTDKYLELDSGWFHAYARFSLPFRMPDFFLVSGLLIARVIDRPLRLFIDRRTVHYLYFLVVWTFIYVPLSWVISAPDTLADACYELLIALTTEPKGNLWFMQMLAAYALAVRFTRNVPAIVTLLAAGLLYFLPNQSHVTLFGVFGSYFIFFFVGYRLSVHVFTAVTWLQEHRSCAIALLSSWIAGNAAIMNLLDFRLGDEPAPALALRFLGIGAVIVFSALVGSMRQLAWLKYAGHNSITIYLGFYVPLSAMVALAPRFAINMRTSWFALLCWLVSVVAPLLVFWIGRRTVLRWLVERPAWAHIDRPTSSPAQVGRRSETQKT